MNSNILVLDNYDSFVYNLVFYLKKLGCHHVSIHRNDKITVDEAASYDKILLSPGPGIPQEAGILLELIEKLAPTKDIFGVCLGHQAIGQVFGGHLVNLSKVYHGLATPITVIENEGLFKNLPQTFKVGRYHSWAISTDNFPEKLAITAVDQNQQIMALRHKTYNVRGVQFHPESILTENGIEMVKNWVGNGNENEVKT